MINCAVSSIMAMSWFYLLIYSWPCCLAPAWYSYKCVLSWWPFKKLPQNPFQKICSFGCQLYMQGSVCLCELASLGIASVTETHAVTHELLFSIHLWSCPLLVFYFGKNKGQYKGSNCCHTVEVSTICQAPTSQCADLLLIHFNLHKLMY